MIMEGERCRCVGGLRVTMDVWRCGWVGGEGGRGPGKGVIIR